MVKWCFNYESGDYEYIERMASVLTEASMFTIGMIANIVAKKMMNAAILCLMMGMTDFDC